MSMGEGQREGLKKKEKASLARAQRRLVPFMHTLFFALLSFRPLLIRGVIHFLSSILLGIASVMTRFVKFGYYSLPHLTVP